MEFKTINKDIFIYIDPEWISGYNRKYATLPYQVIPNDEIEIVRLDPTNPHYIQYKWEKENVIFESYEIMHIEFLPGLENL